MNNKEKFSIEELESRLEMASWVSTKCAMGDAEACAELAIN